MILSPSVPRFSSTYFFSRFKRSFSVCFSTVSIAFLAFWRSFARMARYASQCFDLIKLTPYVKFFLISS